MALLLFRTELGEPDRLRAEARTLAARAEVMREAASRLHEVSTKGVWDSPSGVAFASRVGEVPQTLHRLASTLDEAASVIRPYADLLAESQRVMEHERGRYDEYVEKSNDLKARLATMPPEDPQYARVDRQWRDAADAREFARRRYNREGEQATLDEEAVARRLDDIGAASTDPWGYDLFEGLRHLGTSESVSLVGMVAKPVAAMAFADPIGRLGHKVVYDEGSWTEVGAAAKTALFGLVKLPKGIGATADDVVRQRKLGAEVSAAKARRGAPVAASGSGPKRLRHKAGTKIKQTTAGVKVRAQHGARDVVDNVTGVRLITNMTSDWAAIAGAGHVTSKGVHVLKYSVAAADTVDSTVRTARTTGEKIRSRTTEQGVSPK